MAQIGRQRDEVPGDRVALGVALLQNMRREAMAKVMNAWPPGPLRSNIRKPKDTAECIVHRAGGESRALRRWEEVIVRSCDKAAPVKIAVEGLHYGCVQRHKAAFAELGVADMQDTVGQYVVEPKVERFGYAQSRGGDQSEQHHIELLTQGVGFLPAELTGGIKDAGQFILRVDIGNRPRCAFGEENKRHLMSGVLGPQKAREPHNVTEAAMPGAPSWRHRRPFQRCGGADITLALFRRKARKGLQVSRRLSELEAKSPAKLDVTFRIVAQHGSLPTQGCVISDKRAKSTLA